MASTKKTFSVKCPYCSKEEEYGRGLMNGTLLCPYYKNIFSLVENQGDTHWEVKIKELQKKPIHYQQFTISCCVGTNTKKPKRETKPKS